VTAIAPIGALAPEQISGLFPDDLVAPAAPATAAPGSSFADMVSQGLSEVNDKLQVNEAGLQRLATGDTQNLHHVMIQMEQARLSFQLLMQVRNRLLEAYQDVMKMQV
jgi:flagellar hook-basal body complex protein FliE